MNSRDPQCFLGQDPEEVKSEVRVRDPVRYLGPPKLLVNIRFNSGLTRRGRV